MIDITTSEDYFAKTDRELDWDENDNSKIPMKQADALQKILTAEAGVHVLHRTAGGIGHLVDDMVRIRRDYINYYEQTYEKYVEYNEYY